MVNEGSVGFDEGWPVSQVRYLSLLFGPPRCQGGRDSIERNCSKVPACSLCGCRLQRWQHRGGIEPSRTAGHSGDPDVLSPDANTLPEHSRSLPRLRMWAIAHAFEKNYSVEQVSY